MIDNTEPIRRWPVSLRVKPALVLSIWLWPVGCAPSVDPPDSGIVQSVASSSTASQLEACRRGERQFQLGQSHLDLDDTDNAIAEFSNARGNFEYCGDQVKVRMAEQALTTARNKVNDRKVEASLKERAGQVIQNPVKTKSDEACQIGERQFQLGQSHLRGYDLNSATTEFTRAKRNFEYCGNQSKVNMTEIELASIRKIIDRRKVSASDRAISENSKYNETVYNRNINRQSNEINGVNAEDIWIKCSVVYRIWDKSEKKFESFPKEDVYYVLRDNRELLKYDQRSLNEIRTVSINNDKIAFSINSSVSATEIEISRRSGKFRGVTLFRDGLSVVDNATIGDGLCERADPLSLSVEKKF